MAVLLRDLPNPCSDGSNRYDLGRREMKFSLGVLGVLMTTLGEPLIRLAGVLVLGVVLVMLIMGDEL